jgi:glutaminyl-tRNA synthetase
VPKTGWYEGKLPPEQAVQFERLGYFVGDCHAHGGDTPVFNRTVTLRDSYAAK